MATKKSTTHERNRIASAAWTNEGGAGILVEFSTGERFLYPSSELARVPVAFGKPDTSALVEVGPGGRSILVPVQAGTGEAPIDIAWDGVRYACDARYRAEADRAAQSDAQAVGRRVASVRRRAGLSQERLAERSGVARVTIARIESGAVSPAFSTLGKLARALGLTLDGLLRSEAPNVPARGRRPAPLKAPRSAAAGRKSRTSAKGPTSARGTTAR